MLPAFDSATLKKNSHGEMVWSLVYGDWLLCIVDGDWDGTQKCFRGRIVKSDRRRDLYRTG